MEVSRERVIAKPREAVAGYAMDPENDPEWIGGIKRVRVLTDGPFAVGTQVERTAGFMGRSFDYVLEVAALEPERRIDMRSVRGPFPMDVTYEFDDDAAGTRARITVAGDPGRFYRVAGPLMSAAVGRNLAKDLRELEKRVS